MLLKCIRFNPIDRQLEQKHTRLPYPQNVVEVDGGQRADRAGEDEECAREPNPTARRSEVGGAEGGHHEAGGTHQEAGGGSDGREEEEGKAD